MEQSFYDKLGINLLTESTVTVNKDTTFYNYVLPVDHVGKVKLVFDRFNIASNSSFEVNDSRGKVYFVMALDSPVIKEKLEIVVSSPSIIHFMIIT